MRTRSWSLIAGLLLAASVVEAVRGADLVEIGTRIYPKSSDVQIRVEDRIIGTGVDLAYPTTVRKVNGDWLWIWVHGKKAEGWIKRSDVCTAGEAITYFTQQIAANPNDHRAYYKRGMAWAELGNLDKALDDATQLIRLRPTADSYNSRGTIWCTKREYDIAIKDYDEAIRLDPKYATAYYNRGGTWSDKGELDKALADYNEAIRLDSKYATAYINRGSTWSDKGELDKAFADYSEAIRLDPKHTRAYHGRGYAWSEKGEWDKALADYNEVIRLDPKDALAYCNRAITWKAKSELDKALADYNEVIRLDPKYADAYTGRAWLYATCPNEKYRDGAKAVENATKACELSGWKDAGVLGTLAAAYAEARQFDKAIETQQKAKDLAPEKEKPDYQTRIDLYKSGKPYREEPKSK